MKGSTLTEGEAEEVLAVLQPYSLLFFPIVVDSAKHSAESVLAFRDAQALKLLEDLTRDHDADTVLRIWRLHEDVKRLSPQLFVQAFVTTHLIADVMELATLYYSQRRPLELGSFSWTVDAKDSDLTLMERTWFDLLLPLIYTRSLTEPMTLMPGGDYSALEPYRTPLPPRAGVSEKQYGTNLRMAIADTITFRNSLDDLGLQIADNMSSILTRALNETLGTAGWQDLAPFFVYKRNATLKVLHLSPDPADEGKSFKPPDSWEAVASTLARRAQRMVTPAVQAALRKGGA